MIQIEAQDIHVGETKRIVLTPTDETGAAVTLQAVSVYLYRPDGTLASTLGLTDFTASGGKYTASLSFDTPGTWRVRVEATDQLNNTEIEENQLVVLP